MIKDYLDKSIELLDRLIRQTQEDINNIKQGKHSEVQQSVENKNTLIARFEKVKKDLDENLVLLSDGGKKNLAELLDEEDKAKLSLFKEKLENLHIINRQYAKLVLIVKNFFDGLLNTMFENGNGTSNAYGDKKIVPDSLFKMNV